jgi:phosphoribosylformylglycinamidine synthase
MEPLVTRTKSSGATSICSSRLLRVKAHGNVVAEIPNKALVDQAPVYNRPTSRPAYLDALRQVDLSRVRSKAPGREFLNLLASPTIASKRWVYRQYDHMVRTNTLVLAGMGAGVIRVKGTNRALAMSTDGNGRYCYADPRRGAMLAVAEAARNVACAGAVPIGATNCLNFGNPERSEIMWQFAEAVEGISEACRALDIPITGGNVSLYNETDGTAIYPTPILGVVGLIEDASRVLARTFRAADHEIIALGRGSAELGMSEYLKQIHGVIRGEAPQLNLEAERALIALLTQAAAAGLLQSAHDCSDGGVAVTLAECSFDSSGIGLDVDLEAEPGAPNVDTATGTLFGESASRAIVSVRPSERVAFLKMASDAGVPARMAGRTGGDRIKIAVAGATLIDVPLSEAEQAWSTALASQLARRVA